MHCKTWDTNCRIQFKYAHIKRDGHYTVFYHAPHRVQILSSQGTDLTDKLRWHPAYEAALRLPVGCSVVGELWQPGKPASNTKTAMNACDSGLRFDAFALLRYVNYSLPGFLNADQCADLDLPEVERIVKAYGFSFVEYHQISSNVSNESLHHMCRKMCNDTDIEGFVLKNANQRDWYKLKPTNTIDLIIAGFEPGKGKYVDQIGSLVCRTVEGFEVANVGGMTDDERADMTRLVFDACFKPATLVGRIVEVEYQRVDSNGRLRHPRFIRLRDIDDKDINRCSVSQDPRLEDFWRNRTLFGRCNV